MASVESLQTEIDKIKARNKQVELDKAWETSVARKIIITILTFFVVVIFLYFAKTPKPLLNAIVPTMAFVLSSATLPVFKKIWLKRKK